MPCFSAAIMKWVKDWLMRDVLQPAIKNLGLKSNPPIPNSTILNYPRGSIICLEGTRCEALYLILSGRCEVCKQLEGGRSICERVKGPGETFGHWEILHNHPLRYTIRVVEPSIILKLNSHDLISLLTKRPDLMREVIENSNHSSHSLLGKVKPLPPHYARVITLSSLNSSIPQKEIFTFLSEMMERETKKKILRIVLTPSPQVPLSLRKWNQFTTSPQKRNRSCIHQHIQALNKQLHHLEIHVENNETDIRELSPFLSHLGLEFPYLLIDVPSEASSSILLESIIQSDLSFLLLKQAPKDLYEFNLLKSKIKNRFGKQSQQPEIVKPIFHLLPDENPHALTQEASQPENTSPIYKVIGEAVKEHQSKVLINENFQNPLRRVSREITGKRLGLALSSGGAKGLAHIGVIQVLEEHGIEVDIIAGSSMGAYIAAIWGKGYSGIEMEELAREIRGGWQTFRMLDPVFPPRKGFINGKRIKRRLEKQIKNSQFSDLLRPIRIITTRLATSERVVFSHGNVAAAVHASIAIPGVCAPVTINGIDYIDGGIVDPVPVDVLKEIGIEKVIAVNTLPTPEILKEWINLQEQKKQTPSSIRESLLQFANKHFNYFSNGNILHTMMRSVHGVQMRIAQQTCEEADLVLNPIDPNGHWTEFGDCEKFIALGRQVAESHLDEIKALIKQEKTDHEHKQAA